MKLLLSLTVLAVLLPAECIPAWTGDCSPFPESECQNVRTVAWCESRWDPSKVGEDDERGLMQIHPIHMERIINMGYTWDQMFEIRPNLTVAHAIWLDQGWGPWSCKP